MLGVTHRHGQLCHNPQCQLGQVHILNSVTKHAHRKGKPVPKEDKTCLLPVITGLQAGLQA